MTDRKLTVSVSKDGGHNYLDQREVNLPDQGQYGNGVKFARFGTARDFRFRISGSSAVCVDLLGGYVDYEVSDN